MVVCPAGSPAAAENCRISELPAHDSGHGAAHASSHRREKRQKAPVDAVTETIAGYDVHHRYETVATFASSATAETCVI